MIQAQGQNTDIQMPGPPKKPTALRLLEGNRSKRPLPKNEPKPLEMAPDCPEHLDEMAKREWSRLLPILQRMKVLTEADYVSLSMLCESYSRYRHAQETLKTTGLTITTDKGYVMQHPMLSVVNTSWEQVLKILKEFGLTPSARTRIQTTPEATEKKEKMSLIR